MSAARGLTLEEVVEGAVCRAVDKSLGALRDEMAALRARIPPRLVSVAEAAEATGLCQKTVRRKIAEGRLSAKRVGRRVLVDLSALHATDDEANE
jgi:excisionase family DNA binding protein